jgi:hypothetical protein
LRNDNEGVRDNLGMIDSLRDVRRFLVELRDKLR